MSDTQTLVWEVGCEELPAWACDQLERQVPQLVREALTSARLLDAPDADVRILVGPRRFAAEVHGVRTEQPAVREERRGPAVQAAFQGGDPSAAPTKACEGFARSLGLTTDQLEVREQDGKRFVFGVRELPSAPFAEAWAAAAEQVLGKVGFAKPMRWGSSPHRFVRPIRWVATLLGDEPVEYELWGVRSGDVSRTHRFLGEARSATVGGAGAYERTLADHFVVADQGERRQRIQAALDDAAKTFGGEWYDPAGVLDEVVHLVEYPTVITGRFDESYLELPERVLVTAMQSHQRYLPIRVGERLAPAFLAVMNGDPAAIDSILPGYERVLAGRLDDAVFSFGRDRDRGLDDMATDASLGAVVFHAKAGTLAERRDRIAAVAAEIGAQLGVDRERVAVAARLAKADQVSYVVQEFAELEGFAGSLYATAAGQPADVAAAIDQQFRPRSAEAPLPDSGVPSVIALADKFELLATMFSIGEQPTGSRDPHGLRRAAIGIVRIVLEHDLPLDVAPVIDRALAVVEQGVTEADPTLARQLHEFILDRVEKRLTDDGVRIDAVRAARVASLPRLQHDEGLARALDAAVRAGDPHFLAVATAVKRCAKILEKAGAVDGRIDPQRFEADAERALLAQLDLVGPPVRRAVEERRFDDAVAEAARLGPTVDAFFDRDTGVMVMAEESAVRQNRLLLLRGVLDALAPLGDVTELQVG